MTGAALRLESTPDGVRVIRLINTEKLNAIDKRLRDEMIEATGAIAADTAARALVVTADGKGFCAGADVKELFAPFENMTVEQVKAEVSLIYKSFLQVRALEIPTIAAVNGAAIGAGLNLALCCDVRYAGPRARFGATFSQIGLNPGGGASWFLQQAVGYSRALRVMLDGTIIDAAEAARLGLVEAVVDDPEAAALERARHWAKIPPTLARTIKKSMRTAASQGFEATLAYESDAQAASAKSSAFSEWVAAYLKR
ncbi:MAG: enoyl-CoA hydratase [Chloroflexi bacterium]|nr:enoyl-CoA hydratase [Chloroflexota bacterium]